MILHQRWNWSFGSNWRSFGLFHIWPISIFLLWLNCYFPVIKFCILHHRSTEEHQMISSAPVPGRGQTRKLSHWRAGGQHPPPPSLLEINRYFTQFLYKGKVSVNVQSLPCQPPQLRGSFGKLFFRQSQTSDQGPFSLLPRPPLDYCPSFMGQARPFLSKIIWDLP